MLTLRAFDYSTADYTAITALEAADMPQYANSPAEWQHLDTVRSPSIFFRRDLLLRDRTLVAWGDLMQAYWIHAPDTYEFSLYVHPDHDAPELRPRYYAHVREMLAPVQPRTLITATFEDHTAHLTFLTAQGFRVTLRELEFALDVVAFDPASFTAVDDRVRAAGIRIVPLSDLQRTDTDWKHKVYALRWLISRDVPSAHPPRRPAFDSFERYVLHHPHFVPEGWFIALDSAQQYVGMSRGWLDHTTPGLFNNELTGVLRDYRRRGIATALKLHLIAYARQCGAQVIITGNAEDNPMADLNRTLGFAPRPAWVKLEHRI